MHRILIALFALAFVLPAAQAAPARVQDDEAAAQEALLKDWDAFEAHVRDVERQLAALQGEFSGASDAA